MEVNDNGQLFVYQHFSEYLIFLSHKGLGKREGE